MITETMLKADIICARAFRKATEGSKYTYAPCQTYDECLARLIWISRKIKAEGLTAENELYLFDVCEERDNWINFYAELEEKENSVLTIDVEVISVVTFS